MAKKVTSGDFYNFFFNVVIVKDDQKTRTVFPLWAGPLDATQIRAANFPKSSEPLRSLPFVQEVTVEHMMGEVARITVILTPPYEDGIKLINSELIEAGVSTLEVQFGYVVNGKANLSKVFRGVMLLPEVQIGEDITITLHAQGVGGFAISRVESSETFKKRTVMEILADVLADSGIIPVFRRFGNGSQTATPDQSIAARLSEIEKAVTDTSIEKESVGGRTVFEFVDYLLQQHNCYYLIQELDEASRNALVQGTDAVFTVRSQKVIKNAKAVLYVFPKAGILGGEAEYQLLLYTNPGGFNPQSNPPSYPVFSANTPNMAVFLHGATRGGVIGMYDAKTGKFKNEKISPDEIGRQEKGTKSSGKKASIDKSDHLPEAHKLDTIDRPGHNTKHYMADADTEALTLRERKSAVSQLQDISGNFGVNMTVETLGIPDIQPGHSVELRGVGIRYSGKYAVMRVVHTAGPNGYMTTLEMIANAMEILTAASANSSVKYAPANNGPERKTPPTPGDFPLTTSATHARYPV
jgi:hypothetical protein